MKDKVNFLVTTLDEENEAKKQQGMTSFGELNDQGGNYDNREIDQYGKPVPKECRRYIIIYPQTSRIIKYWNYLMNAIFMYGYFMDPYHIAVYICSGHVNSTDTNF